MAASKKDVAKQQVKEDREKVREMYLSGKTVKEIAKETYFSSSYCYAMVRDLAKEKNFAKKQKSEYNLILTGCHLAAYFFFRRK
jgi:hypothetical protein